MSTNSPAAGFTAKATRLTLLQPWRPPSVTSNQPQNPSWPTDVLRQTVVYALTELLDLAEEPLDIDIEGDTIELDGVYDGLESGRWIIVSGERTDIPNVSGVTASELVMIAGVEQGSRMLFCASWPFSNPPFSQVAFVTPPNRAGDRLVIGKLQPGFVLNTPPSTTNQQYCDQVELAHGFFVNAYVPTQDEISGHFSEFQDLLVDPSGNQIKLYSMPTDAVFASSAGNTDGLWGWRISSAKVNTILTLANNLAYTYDVSKVTIYGNVVKATHGETRNEVLGNGDGSQVFQQFALKQKPLTFVPASNPSGTDSTLEVYVNNVEWQETDTLAGLGAKDRDFIPQTADDDTTAVTFGNGLQGARLPTGVGNVSAV